MVKLTQKLFKFSLSYRKQVSMNNQYNNILLINCPACQNGVSSQAVSCPRCGQPLQPKSYQQPLRKSFVVSTTIVFFLATIYTQSIIPLIIAIPSVILLLFVLRYVNGNFQNKLKNL